MPGWNAETGPGGEIAMGGRREELPAFVRHGIFTVVVYAVVMTGLVSRIDPDGTTLVTFTAGFSVFLTAYFLSMYVGWLFLRRGGQP